ncbi:Tektin-2 [Danaus plexippus plexippus]|uniref:Tektin n=1 Tax=Danaus plexippus plexippus TaxID=278856 RepID=A0A212EU56_DANPL|nr:Tektin-2 [Danaus plexippus plexippus]
MFCEDVCLGATRGIDKLRAISDELSEKVVEQLTGNQELVMITDLERESNDYQYKKCVKDRVVAVGTRRSFKRLQEAIDALKYEHNALRVVVDRVQKEIKENSNDGSQRGALCPLTDDVEDSIIQEYEFLRDQKKYFENLIEELYKKTSGIERIKIIIDRDISNKKQALRIEESSLNNYFTDGTPATNQNKKRGSPIKQWEKRCSRLKRSGLKALCNAVVTRKQVRAARMKLSISAQAFSLKVDAILRRRLHTNKIKLQDLNWQREEAARDYDSLQEELTCTEMAIIETMNQKKLVESRLANRSHRPTGELTKDDVNRTLREEQVKLRKTLKDLRNNIDRIVTLQNKLGKAVANIDCCANDLIHVISLDEERIRSRQGEPKQSESITTTSNTHPSDVSQPRQSSGQLAVIQEEDENDYPFDF